MSIYTATFSAVAVTAAQDVFELTVPTTQQPVAIHEIELGQYTDFGDAAAEILSVQLIRDYTAAGSGGAAVTPGKTDSRQRAATTTIARNNTTVANTGTPTIIRATTWNIAKEYLYRPRFMPEWGIDERPILNPGQIFVVRITAPADSITMNGTIVFKEGVLSRA